jgi:hypothetical protein
MVAHTKENTTTAQTRKTMTGTRTAAGKISIAPEVAYPAACNRAATDQTITETNY